MKVLDSLALIAWLLVVVGFWMGYYDPPWWFVGIAFTSLALDAAADFVKAWFDA